MKKILILSMFCNDRFFEDEEELCRRTWACDIIDGKYPNVEFYGYTASTDGKYHISGSEHVIRVPADDGLSGTAEKTVKCLKFIERLGIRYDVMLRTNTSSYINVPLLIDMAESFYDDAAIWSGTIFSSNDRSGPYVGCPHARGNAITIPHSVIRKMIDADNMRLAFSMEKSNVINNTICPIKDAIYTVDDNFLAFVYNSAIISEKKNVMDFYKTFGDYGVREPIEWDCASHAIVISFRIYDYSFDSEIKDRYYEFGICESLHRFISARKELNHSLIYEYINDNLVNYSYSRPNDNMTTYYWMGREDFMREIMPTYDIPYTK